MTPDTTQTEQVAADTGNNTGNGTADPRELFARARVVLWDFDGPICRLFAGHSAEGWPTVWWSGSRGGACTAC